MNYVLKGPINNIPALVQIMTRPQAIIWNNDGKLTDANLRHSASMS